MFLAIDLAGQTLTSEDQDILRHPAIAMVILFTRNYDNPLQLKALTDAIRNTNPALIIATDHEGGRVQRFQTGFTRLPSMRSWCQSSSELDKTIKIMANELHAVGVDMPLMPVLDIDYGVSDIIHDRSLGHTADEVTVLGSLILSSLKRYGMPSTAKHFPGHGAVRADSHQELPVDTRSLSVILDTDIKPYRALIDQIDTIMPAHIVYSAVDPLPAGFSAYWLQTILREELGFKGVIISDCISMEATKSYGDDPARALLALKAGCDIVIACNHRAGVVQILDKIGTYSYAESEKRLKTLQKSLLMR